MQVPEEVNSHVLTSTDAKGSRFQRRTKRSCCHNRMSLSSRQLCSGVAGSPAFSCSSVSEAEIRSTFAECSLIVPGKAKFPNRTVAGIKDTPKVPSLLLQLLARLHLSARLQRSEKNRDATSMFFWRNSHRPCASSPVHLR